MAGIFRLEMGSPAGRVSATDALLALALSAFGVALTDGPLDAGSPHTGVVAAVAVLLMTAPVAWRRYYSVEAAAVAAAGAIVNGALVGPIVRCGAALPAVFLISFAIGSRVRGRPAWAGLGLCGLDVVAQTIWDPNLGAGAMILMVPAAVAFFGIGRLVQSRVAAAEELRRQSAELHRQREETARMAVRADRAQVVQSLDGLLHQRMAGIADQASAGSAGGDPAAVRATLEAIEHEGRGVLQAMREVVGDLKTTTPTEPQPTLAQLDSLLARAVSADTRLKIEGAQRSLPAALELSGYRIVEHLLGALEDSPDHTVEVRLVFAADCLELHVSGPASPSGDVRSALAAAQERAALHGGSLLTDVRRGLSHVVARLPLVSGHA